MERRDALKILSGGVAGAGLWPSSAKAMAPVVQTPPAVAKSAGPVRIRDVKTILTAPDGIRLVVVKVETSEPGLYGLGCATFTQRARAVETAVDKYLKPFLLGKNPLAI